MNQRTPFEERMTRALFSVGAALSEKGNTGIPLFEQSTDHDGPDLFKEVADTPRPDFRQAAEAEVAETAERAILAVGSDIWENFEYALRAEPMRIPDAVEYAIRAVREGRDKAADRSHTGTRATLSAAFKVRREILRFQGILRFAPDDDGTYRAFFEPDNDILEVLVPSFLRRFGVVPFSITDVKRNRTAEARGGRVAWTTRPYSPSFVEPTQEAVTKGVNTETCAEDVESLWRAYYRATENPSRSNPTLRLKFMPRRYWRHLPELSDDQTAPHDPGE